MRRVNRSNIIRMRRQWPFKLLTAIALVLSLMSAVPPAVAADQGVVSFAQWFRLDKDQAETWHVKAVSPDGRRLSIQPRRAGGTRPAGRVLVLYTRASPAYDIAISRVLSEFADKGIDTEFTVSNFAGADDAGRSELERAARDKQQLILSMGSDATAWLWRNYRGGSLPVVSICAKDPVLLGQADDYARGSGTNFAFTSLNMPVEAQMAYIRRLRPGLKNLALLVDADNFSAVQTQVLPLVSYGEENAIRVLPLEVRKSHALSADVTRVVKNAVQRMMATDPQLQDSAFWITGSTILFSQLASISRHAGNAIVLSAVPDLVNSSADSALMSVGISFDSNAHLAAVYAADVLSGRRKVSDLPVGVVSPPDVAFSFRKASNLGLKIPFSLFEAATTIYDNDGRLVRAATGGAADR